ncbi:hypothetical protein AMS68_003479 [Peltaster fructicola]|uniref:Uncharacterized protein n=1 Tax=Peltaster fructicola TaxID=286661 RepID=A0A6H0XT63_9PEZI|nr:hypothetical protein AMS68_003479 [Peltaster fructicola]
MWEGKSGDDRPSDDVEDPEEDTGDVDDAGDDFDDFAEEGDDDFGDFDEADDTPIPTPQPIQQTEAPNLLADLPLLDFSSDDRKRDTVTAYLGAVFADTSRMKQVSYVEPQQPTAFLSERSLSLWQQLVSPPPMQPPNWTRSRIRRLFLVSLGVPVNLDEILPPSKQKRLVLPNINLATSPRASSVMERLRDSTVNASNTSIDSKSGAPKPQRTKRAPKGPPPPPEFDLNAAALICNTTVEAMNGYDDAELKDHLSTLELLNNKSSSVLEYWLVRKDESVREKEALEGVIENLVGFVKGRRGK